MDIHRQRPGDIALASGWFALIGEHGKSAHLPVEVKRGERLPLVSVGDDLGTLHWVLTSRADQDAQAA